MTDHDEPEGMLRERHPFFRGRQRISFLHWVLGLSIIRMKVLDISKFYLTDQNIENGMILTVPHLFVSFQYSERSLKAYGGNKRAAKNKKSRIQIVV